jgi:hypothetical protein
MDLMHFEKAGGYPPRRSVNELPTLYFLNADTEGRREQVRNGKTALPGLLGRGRRGREERATPIGSAA